MNNCLECIGVVLAGGRSSRMGRNKAQLKLGEQTMLNHCQQLLQQCHVSKVVISGANNGGIADVVANAGPLAGIYSVIQQYRPSSLLVLPIDMPFIEQHHLQKLKLKGSLANKVTRYQHSSLPAYIPVSAPLLDYLERSFASEQFVQHGKGPSFKQAFARTSVIDLDIDSPQALVNTNTPEQWQQALTQLKQQKMKGRI
ncbi:molybdenum cofactor guanylyltransferase [Thalassotalea maritima]|uniref:molybdenum cofactor guanylyltransferase n=1 Tax=Thalassotalea maritima TaxID=3242416 RepID=UPI003528BF7A